MKKAINKEQITLVKVFRKTRNKWIEYRKESGVWIFKKPAGFYYTRVIGDAILLTEEDIKNEECYAEDNVVYYYPHLEINMSDKSIHSRFFLTLSALNDYIDKELSGVNFISI